MLELFNTLDKVYNRILVITLGTSKTNPELRILRPEES